MKAFVSEKSELQKRLFWLSNFTGAVILNICDVSWLPYCSDTKSDCSGTIGQARHYKFWSSLEKFTRAYLFQIVLEIVRLPIQMNLFICLIEPPIYPEFEVY